MTTPDTRSEIPYAQRLLAKGAPITLADGTQVRCRFGMRSLVALEDRFGSLSGVQAAFASLENGQGAAFTTIVDLVGVSLMHEGLTSKVLLERDLLDPASIGEYATAALEAFREAFPTAKPGSPGNDEAEAQAASPGPTGTTSELSSSDAATPSSG